MNWDLALMSLRDVLAGLYPREEDARVVALDAGLDLTHITFSNNAANNWTSILLYAANNEQVENVIGVACQQYQGSSALATAAQTWRAGRGGAAPSRSSDPIADWARPSPPPEWDVQPRLRQSLPLMDDLFEVLRDPSQVPAAIFGPQPAGGLAPYHVPYFNRGNGSGDHRGALYEALLNAGGALLIQGGAGLGKTRELAELAWRLCRGGWTVCVAQLHSAANLDQLRAFPAELRRDKLLLVFDDLHHHVIEAAEGMVMPYAERLEALWAYLDRRWARGRVYVVAAAGIEPQWQEQLGYLATRAPWRRFDLYELPPFTVEALEQVLVSMAEMAGVTLDRAVARQMVENSDRTLGTLSENLELARRDRQPLTLERWLPSRGESWEDRLTVARSAFPAMDVVYGSLHLLRETGMPARIPYVVQLSGKLGQVDSQPAVDGLLDMGLLGLRHGILRAFGAETFAGHVDTADGDLAAETDPWGALVRVMLEVPEPPEEWPADLVGLAEMLLKAERYPQAIEVADAAIARLPDGEDAYVVRGKARLDSLDFRGAAADLTAAIEGGRHEADVYVARGLAYYSMLKPEAAYEDFHAALEHNHEDPDAYLGVGGVLASLLEDWGEAEIAFTGAIERGAGSMAYSLRGWVRHEQGDYAGADEDYTVALEQDPENVDLYWSRSKARAGLGDWSGLKSDAEAALARGREDGGLYYGLGVALAGLQDASGAEAAFNQAIEAGFDEASAYSSRGMARRVMGDGQAAEADYTTAIERGGDDGTVYAGRAKARRMQENYAGAEEDFTRAIERNPEDAELFRERGLTRLLQGDAPGAAADLTVAIEGGQDDADAYYLRGLADWGLDDYAEAEADFAAALAGGREDADTYVYRAEARRKQGNLAGALADAATALERGAEAPLAHTIHGLALYQSGRWQEAADAHREALALNPSSLDDWVSLAACGRRTGDEEAWREAVEKARALLDPEDAYSAAWIHAVAGEMDLALEQLARALEERPKRAGWARQDLDQYWICEDPRFEQILEGVTAT